MKRCISPWIEIEVPCSSSSLSRSLSPLSVPHSWPRSEWRRQDEHQGLPVLHQRRPAAHRPDEVPLPWPAHLHHGPLHGSAPPTHHWALKRALRIEISPAAVELRLSGTCRAASEFFVLQLVCSAHGRAEISLKLKVKPVLSTAIQTSESSAGRFALRWEHSLECYVVRWYKRGSMPPRTQAWRATVRSTQS